MEQPIMRSKLTAMVWLVLIFGIAMSAGAQTVLLYRDAFDGTAGTPLHGTRPDIDQVGGVNTWVAHSSWKADGVTGQYSTATLPFTPQSGYLYRLRVSLADVTGGDYWLAAGFAAGSSTLSGQRFLGVPTTGYAWMLRRGNASTLPDQLFAGPGTADGVEVGASLDRSKAIDLQFLLDTRSEQWRAEWYQKLTTQTDYAKIHSFTYPGALPIGAVGFASGQTTIQGRLAGFSLERIQTSLRIVDGGQPQDVVITGNQPVAFTVRAVCDSLPTAHWRRIQGESDLPVPVGAPAYTATLDYDAASGQTIASLTLTAPTAQDEGRYYCILEETGALTVQSDMAWLEIDTLVAHWPLGAGTVVSGSYRDSQGGFDAVIAGQPAYAADPWGLAAGAIAITPAGGWATAPPLQPLGRSGQFSITLWFRWLGGRSDQTGPGNLVMEGLWNGSSRLDNAVAATGWQFLCIAFDGVTGRIYLNGDLKLSQSWQPVDPAALTVEIGHAGGGQLFNGDLDDIRIYNYALTTTQVSSLYSGQADCVLAYADRFDFTGPRGRPDCRVDLYDLLAFLADWMSCGVYPECR